MYGSFILTYISESLFTMKTDAGNIFSLSFPAIRGIQAGREYYITMCPLDTVCRITVYNEDELPPDFRAQRTLNRRRVPEIVRYILDNPNSYVFSALTVSVDSKMIFSPLVEEPSCNQGILSVPASAKFVVNDGQHRRAAIFDAIKENEELASETIPLVIFLDSDLKKSQQMFADLNRYAARPTKSLSILYDRRDPVAATTLGVISAVPLFRGSVDFEKTSLSNRSTKLFTLSNVYDATCMLLNKSKGEMVSQKEKKLASNFWIALSAVIPDWKSYIAGEVKSSLLRKQFVHSHGVILVALGILGRSLIQQHPENWRSYLLNLNSLDWKRTNVELWEGVAMEGGKISKAHRNIRRTSIRLKETIGLDLTQDEVKFMRTETHRWSLK